MLGLMEPAGQPGPGGIRASCC